MAQVITLKANELEVKVYKNHRVELEDLQKAVGGYIESYPLGQVEKDSEVVIWLNEEGKLNNLQPNLALVYRGQVHDVIVGDIIITATNRLGETIGLTDKEVAHIKESIKVQNFNGNQVKYIEL